MRVYLAHGMESSPWSAKMIALADVAKAKGFRVEIPDYSDLCDPDERVERLIELCGESDITTVLAGSSMGGYVSTVASSAIRPNGLFLLAPAFYLPDYDVQEPVPCSGKTVIVHGWNDAVVPVDNSIRFAGTYKAEMHLVNSDHRMMDQLPWIEKLFALFLDEIVERDLIAKGLTARRLSWCNVAGPADILLNRSPHFTEPCLEWLQRVWDRIDTQGKADYTNEAGKYQVIVRFTALIDFFREFLRGIDCYFEEGDFEGETFKDESEPMEIRVDHLSGLISDMNGWTDDDGQADFIKPAVKDLHQIYEQAVRKVVYPAMLKEFGSTAWLATTLYQTVCPSWDECDIGEFLIDPQEPETESDGLEDLGESLSILSWVNEKLSREASSIECK